MSTLSVFVKELQNDPIPIRVVDCDKCPYHDMDSCDDGDKCPADVQSLVCDFCLQFTPGAFP